MQGSWPLAQASLKSTWSLKVPRKMGTVVPAFYGLMSHFLRYWVSRVQVAGLPWLNLGYARVRRSYEWTNHELRERRVFLCHSPPLLWGVSLFLPPKKACNKEFMHCMYES